MMSMNNSFFVFLGRYHLDIATVIASLVTLILGCYSAWQLNPQSLNRAGALLIVWGVLLGASRFYDKVEDHMMEKFTLEHINVDDLLSKILSKIGKSNEFTKIVDGAIASLVDIEQLSPEQYNELKSIVLEQLKSRAREMLKKNHLPKMQREYLEIIQGMLLPEKQRIKRLEVIIVVSGTVLSGFGDLLINALKEYLS